MNIAFIGLGRMGTGIARNLLLAGHRVVVFNRTPSKAAPLLAAGAEFRESPAIACDGADVAVTMLSDDPALETIVFGEQGIAVGLRSGAVHISHSTISTALARRLTVEHDNRGQGFVSAPVFGRPEAAEARKLVVLCAGAKGHIATCLPLLDSIGRETFQVGEQPWQANAVKLFGNFMVVSIIEALGEATAALRKTNVDPHVFVSIMSSLFGSAILTNYGRTIADENYEPAGFALSLGLKDVRLMLAASEEYAAPLPLASLIHDSLLAAFARGQGELDWSSVARISAFNAGL